MIIEEDFKSPAERVIYGHKADVRIRISSVGQRRIDKRVDFVKRKFRISFLMYFSREIE
ncbi:hypothetical protein [Caldicellulosiruptor acetigenus]|uniref:hypothetical protein n=1 Tax=Caldicellulosiruptor acetigenus TaxID=301953 RepID=UPI0003F526D9